MIIMIISQVLVLSACCFAMLDILNKKFAFSESIVSMLFYGSQGERSDEKHIRPVTHTVTNEAQQPLLNIVSLQSCLTGAVVILFVCVDGGVCALR